MKNWVIAAILIVLAAAAYYYFGVSRTVEAPAVVSSSIPDRAPEQKPVVTPEPEPATPAPAIKEGPRIDTEIPVAAEMDEIPQPMLMDSDPVVLENLKEMVGEPAVIRYVVNDNVISRIVATVDTLGSRQIPAVVQVVNGPATSFAASPNDNPDRVIRNEEGDAIPQFIINPANYERYTPYVELFEAVDSAEWVKVYRDYDPLFLEAYRQMGYPEGSFNDRLIVIIDELLATLPASDPVELMKPEAYYLFVDQDFEALTAGQKILLRMGNQNASRVKVKLQEIRELL
jgi:hypothetical protein